MQHLRLQQGSLFPIYSIQAQLNVQTLPILDCKHCPLHHYHTEIYWLPANNNNRFKYYLVFAKLSDFF